MEDSDISMVQECTAEYVVNETADGGVEIRIRAPRRFKMLWIVRLSELRTSLDEIKEYENANFDDG